MIPPSSARRRGPRARLHRPPAVARCAAAAGRGPGGKRAGMSERVKKVVIAVVVAVGIAAQIAWLMLLLSPLAYLL